MLDLLIKDGLVVDGTGTPPYRANVGIRSGLIVDVGKVDETARETIQADGRVVTPGFIDVHTHYDAQVFWDPYLTPSIFNGVTSVIAGNCGFTLAPLPDVGGSYLMEMLSRVEGMPIAALKQGVPWGTWKSTADYFALLDGNLAINAGFKVGHSTIRRVVMGDAATQRSATTDEIEAMQGLLRRGLEAGALGFSSSWCPTHVDANGDPVPSRWASADEILALAGVCGDFDGTSLEFLPDFDEDFERNANLTTRMSAAARRTLNWNQLEVAADREDLVERKLSVGDRAQKEGGRVVALTMPMQFVMRYSFLTAFLLDALKDWAAPMALPVRERLEFLQDPHNRRVLEEGGLNSGAYAQYADWPNRVIQQTFAPELSRYEGRLVADIAAEENKRPFDALLDIVCADELRTIFTNIPPVDSVADWELKRRVWRDGRALIGASDAGAHLDFIDTFKLQAWFLQRVVDELQLVPLEEAIHYFTDAPARLYGLRGRGRLAPGYHADVVVFDPQTVGCEPVALRFDLPGDAGRLFARSTGFDHVFVNGIQVLEAGHTIEDRRPGKVLRSGADTFTPSLNSRGDHPA